MPILKENRSRYPDNWKQIRQDILKRAQNQCEFCGIENYSIRKNGSKVVLTIAHLDHIPENCDYENLRALCQKCHNNYDKEHRKETRMKRRIKMEKKKAMLSQPLNGKSKEEIEETRNRAIAKLESMGYEVINTLFTDEWYSKEKMKERGVVQIPLRFLAKSLENMSLCHAAYFCKGWDKARGCKIEHDAAVAYGLEVIEEE